MYVPAELQPPARALLTNQKIYTTHAAGKQVSLLPGLLAALDAVLVDIRFAPPAQPIKWSKNYLKLLLRNRYLHVPTLGDRFYNDKNRSDKPAIHNLTLGIKIITELKINVLLFCACETAESCHRHFIGRELIGQGKEIIKIEAWD